MVLILRNNYQGNILTDIVQDKPSFVFIYFFILTFYAYVSLWTSQYYQDNWQIVDIQNKNNIEIDVLPNTKIFYFA